MLQAIKLPRSFYWRHPLCYKIVDKEHGQTPYVLPSRKNYDGDRLSYLKLYSTCFGKFRGGVCGCVSSFAPRVVPLDKDIYSNLCLLNNGYRQKTAGVTLR